MTYFVALILFSIILTIGGVYGRTLAHRPTFAHKVRNFTNFTDSNESRSFKERLCNEILQAHDGQTYECVDFYEQPAFSHPSLKHLVPKDRKKSTKSKKVKFNESEGCPSGTVPIASSTGEPKPRLVPAQVHCYAVVRTKLDGSNKKFYGTNALVSTHKPAASGYQWSASRFKLSSGSESIEVGWVVFPDYFKDNDAHFFVLYTAGTSRCFNTDCPGFVQQSSHTRLGDKPDKYSEIGGQQRHLNISIELDKGDGNWHLYLTSDIVGKDAIGYWPGSLFEQLKNSAAQAEWAERSTTRVQLPWPRKWGQVYFRITINIARHIFIKLRLSMKILTTSYHKTPKNSQIVRIYMLYRTMVIKEGLTVVLYTSVASKLMNNNRI